MSLGQRVIATQRVYLLAQGSPPNQGQPAWRLMNMKIQEEFVHFFHNVDSFREIQEDKIPVTDVTAFPALSLMLEEIGITPSMGVEAISKILTRSLGSCPPLPQLIRNSTEDKLPPSDLTGPQKRKKDLSRLVGTIVYNKKQGEEQKSMVLFFESLNAYRAISKAIENAVQWVRHYYYSLEQSLKPSKYFLNWIVESSNDPNPEHPPFLIDLSFFKQGTSEQEFRSLGMFLGQFRNVWAIGFQTVQKYTLDMLDLSFVTRLFVKENQISMLSLAKCYCSDDFFSGFFTQLEQFFPNIITLNLSENYLTDASLDNLAAFITSFDNLETLDISHNFFCGENTAAFSNLLISLSSRPVKDDFYHGVKLFASYNLFTDAIIKPFEEAVLFSTGSQFFYLDFSFNSLSSYGLWRIFSNLKCRQEIPQFSTVQETLVINLYPLPFNADILNSTVNYFYTLYAAKSMYEDQVNKEYQMLMRNEDIKLLGDNKNDQSQQQQSEANSAFMTTFLQQTDKSLSLMLTRKRLQPYKPLPNKVAYIKKTKEINEEILRICNSKEFTIEQLMEFCQEIYDLEFEFPLKKLEPLQRIVKDIIEEAFLIRDHYSIHILGLCCEMIGVDWAMLRHSHDIVSKRKAELIKQIEQFLMLKFLNNDETESSANGQFDKLVSECLRMDLRGTAVDLLFLIKQRRDQMIVEEQNTYIAQGELEELKKKQQQKQIQQLKQSQQLLMEQSSQKYKLN